MCKYWILDNISFLVIFIFYIWKTYLINIWNNKVIDISIFVSDRDENETKNIYPLNMEMRIVGMRLRMTL